MPSMTVPPLTGVLPPLVPPLLPPQAESTMVSSRNAPPTVHRLRFLSMPDCPPHEVLHFWGRSPDPASRSGSQHNPIVGALSGRLDGYYVTSPAILTQDRRDAWAWGIGRGEASARHPSTVHSAARARVKRYFCSPEPDVAPPPLAQNSIRSDLEMTPRKPSGPLTAIAAWPPTSAV